jgi:hypothetical protein
VTFAPWGDIFYPRNFACFSKNELFQHPPHYMKDDEALAVESFNAPPESASGSLSDPADYTPSKVAE